jgi:hypothetical protein
MKVVKRQQRVTRTRVYATKLLELRRFQRPLWIRRVLVRAQEGQLEARWLLGSRRALPIC